MSRITPGQATCQCRWTRAFSGLAVHQRWHAANRKLGTLLQQAYFVVYFNLAEATTGRNFADVCKTNLARAAKNNFGPGLAYIVLSKLTARFLLRTVIDVAPDGTAVALLVDADDVARSS